ncbi:MAG: DUF3606 domain-containing protein [Gammaproteobacteria bacterium]|nr:DUF3606 domain-containing protein [Gammaproteobacteria bacterium]
MQQDLEQIVPDAAAPADELSAVRINDAAEAKAWCLLFGCSLLQLQAAVAAVGGDPDRIQDYLAKLTH